MLYGDSMRIALLYSLVTAAGISNNQMLSYTLQEEMLKVAAAFHSIPAPLMNSWIML